MLEPYLKSFLTMEEIKDNFGETDFFTEITEGLGEVLALIRETDVEDRRLG